MTPEFDRIDICEAYWLYAHNWHEGQFSSIYKIFGRLNNIKFKVRHSLFDFYSLSENGRLIYCNLVKHKHLQGE